MHFDARTAEGRDTIKTAVKRCLGSKTGKNAKQLAEQVGCTPMQARKALAELVTDGIAKREGLTRATKYTLN